MSISSCLNNIGIFLLLTIFGVVVTCASHSGTMSDSKDGKPVMVGGTPMSPNKNIIENVIDSNDHTTLMDTIKSAGLVEALKAPGLFTVFAPTNQAFVTLPKGTVETLLQPEHKDTLLKILTYHVVAGKLDVATLMNIINEAGGSAELKTISGGILTVSLKSKKIVVTDEKNNKATITIPDVYQKNGVIHVVDTVFLPLPH